jgi:hypothetical protein
MREIGAQKVNITGLEFTDMIAHKTQTVSLCKENEFTLDMLMPTHLKPGSPVGPGDKRLFLPQRQFLNKWLHGRMKIV